MSYMLVFFFKQKTAYEMRISDWSSDVCSSDLIVLALQRIVSRTVNPMDPAVVSVTQIHAGTNFNVIPAEAVITGTTRALTVEVHDLLEARVRQEIGRASCRERVCQYV